MTYEVIEAGAGVTIYKAKQLSGGWDGVKAAARWIVQHKATRCQIVAEEDGRRRFLDGYEQAELNRYLGGCENRRRDD